MDISFDYYIKQIMSIPLLSAEETKALLIQSKKGDMIAKNKLIESNLKFVIKIAKRKKSQNFFLQYRMDLIQEGNIGLMKAIEKFDVTKPIKFSTYAAWWIQQHIDRFIQNKQKTIRLPVYKEELISQIKRSSDRLRLKHCRNATIEEIAKDLNKPSNTIKDAFINLSEMSSDSDTTLIESTMNITNSELQKYHPEQIYFDNLLKEDIESLFNFLDEREQKVVKLRYAFAGFHKHTLKKTSEILRVSPETVRKIEKRAIKKLKSYADHLRE